MLCGTARLPALRELDVTANAIGADGLQVVLDVLQQGDCPELQVGQHAAHAINASRI